MARFEGSAKDKAEDAKLAKKAGMSAKEWERSAADKKHDAAGARTSKKAPPRRKAAPMMPPPGGLAMPPGGSDEGFGDEGMGGMGGM